MPGRDSKIRCAPKESYVVYLVRLKEYCVLRAPSTISNLDFRQAQFLIRLNTTVIERSLELTNCFPSGQQENSRLCVDPEEFRRTWLGGSKTPDILTGSCNFRLSLDTIFFMKKNLLKNI